MKGTGALVAMVLLGVSACSSRKHDPPPPASSAVVPPAAPHARGTMAAGSAPVPSLAVPEEPGTESEEPPAPALPAPAADSGVEL